MLSDILAAIQAAISAPMFTLGGSMKNSVAISTLAAFLTSSAASAVEGPVPAGVPHLDHVFVIMMENHGYSQIIGNPNAPFANNWAKTANSAQNYFAVGHPSLTNYLEVVGGSNFGIRSDNSPAWHDTACAPNLVSGIVNADSLLGFAPSTAGASVCPIAGVGKDAATPAVDCVDENNPGACTNDIDGTNRNFPVAANTSGKTIADQLAAKGLKWRAYEENLPITGPDGVNSSDGQYSNLTDFTKITPTLTPPLTSGNIVSLYAVKHNPFAYFANVQSGANPEVSYKQMVGFDGANGLWANLATGHVANYNYIVPNQCNDQHGRGNSTAFCNYDPSSDGTQAGLNPALIALGDLSLQKIVEAIHASPVWHEGRTAIVAIWDENDYSNQPNTNQVPAIVDTNYGVHGQKSSVFYTHFSLLKSIESGFDLPCLNHACDSDQHVMSDMFFGHETPHEAN